MEPTLVVLAAGMGSRYGGLKQLDGVGPSGETIMDYTIFDAVKAGFGKLVFVIREGMEADFRETVLSKIDSNISVEIVFQELTDLPDGLTLPPNRKKPWGTAHALWVCRNVVDTPFAMVNADDFYGQLSLQKMAEYLSDLGNEELAACMVGYQLGNTLSAHGSVSRGICKTDDAGHLLTIKERASISKKGDHIFYEQEGARHYLTGQETASMNLMGFTPAVFAIIEEGLLSFYEENSQDLKAEYYAPEILQELINRGIKIPVLPTSSEWFGVTYKEDKHFVQKQLLERHRQGVYPLNLAD